jgi:hypothetical protein
MRQSANSRAGDTSEGDLAGQHWNSVQFLAADGRLASIFRDLGLVT